MKAKIVNDDSGLNLIVEYLLTFIIASILFSIVLLLANSAFIEGPQRTVSIVQFTDIGNDITAKMVDTYLIAPEMGNVSTTFNMPYTVAGNAYNANVVGMGNDKEVNVYLPDGRVSITVTLNGVNSTIPVSGNTSSLSGTHRIYYQKT